MAGMEQKVRTARTARTAASAAGTVAGMFGLVGLAGCGASGTAGAGPGSAGRGTGTTVNTGAAATGGGSTAPGGDTATGGGGGSVSGGASSQAGGVVSSGGWILSMPSTLLGMPQIQAPTAMTTKIDGELAKRTSPLGVSGGRPVIAVYDDTKQDVYIIVAGYDGCGFDPSKLTKLVTAVPHTDYDGTGDRVTFNSVAIDGGDHGGAAGCSSEVVQSGGLAGESTVCSWMTPTTMGSVTYYPKPDHQQVVLGTGPEVLGKAMRDIRDVVERRT
jgi:hypothetical protein